MPSVKTQFAVGLFVSAGIGIAVLAFIWLGMSRYLDRGSFYASYFDESVQGLERDSPVKYRGVSVGRVASIDVAPDSRLIRVVMEIDPFYRLDANMAAQLKAVGITGSMFIELDQINLQDKRLSPPLNFPSEYPVVASRPSEIRRLLAEVDDILRQFKGLDLEAISEKTKAVLDTVNKSVGDLHSGEIADRLKVSIERFQAILGSKSWQSLFASLDKAGEDLGKIMGKAYEALDKVNNSFAHAEKSLQQSEPLLKETVSEIRGAVGDARVFFSDARAVLEKSSGTLNHMTNQLVPVVQNLAQSVEILRELMERLSLDPSTILFGRPPNPAKPEELPGGD
ncbi:MAG: MCE family protein [Desulfobacteraceae bacterium]|nr:MAG: MCE family protein [Desulfobacteraceae bacterium]